MSFFNLTIYGPQNKLKEYKIDETSKSVRSIEDYHEMKKKKALKEPNQVYKQPVTCAQQIGWWTKDSDLEWSKVEKHVFPKSEMTSFADKMTLADKSFRMY